MKPMFLPDNQPLSTCNQTECTSCNVKKDVVCHYNGKQLSQFLLMMTPSFIFGGKILLDYSHIYFYVWIVLIPLYFGFIEIWAMCSHCPHYAEPSIKSLNCWANYGAPKIWKYKPGPMSIIEKVIFIAGMAIIFITPAIIALMMGQIFNSIFCFILTVVTFSLLGSFFCTRCINFACVFNKTPVEIREIFFKNNPEIAKAWNKD